MLNVQPQPQKEPNVLPLETIKKIVDTQDWVTFVKKRNRILVTLGVLRKEFEDKVQAYLQEEVMPKVYEKIDEFLVKRDLTLVAFFDLDLINVSVCDKQQYSEFQNGDRYESPKLKWEDFADLQKMLKEEINARIKGSKNPQTGAPTWTIVTNVPQSLLDEYADTKALIDSIKAKYLEIDQSNAKMQEEVEQESAYKEVEQEQTKEVLSEEEPVEETKEEPKFEEEPDEAPGLKNNK